jgi:pyruvate/2-oxoglutarate dehydrogenase complex dihydrolipoamide acyltransferase (E2) component
MARAAGIEPYSTRQAVQNIQEREERSQASMSKVPLPSALLALNLGSAMRQNIIRQIEAGGTPVRENGMVIGVMSNGRYTGRQREADRLAMQEANRGDGAAQAAQMGAGAPQPDQPAAAPAPPVVRRSALAQQIEAENRRRRLAGLRRLGARTLLSGDRFTADTLGAG